MPDSRNDIVLEEGEFYPAVRPFGDEIDTYTLYT